MNKLFIVVPMLVVLLSTTLIVGCAPMPMGTTVDPQITVDPQLRTLAGTYLAATIGLERIFYDLSANGTWTSRIRNTSSGAERAYGSSGIFGLSVHPFGHLCYESLFTGSRMVTFDTRACIPFTVNGQNIRLPTSTVAGNVNGGPQVLGSRVTMLIRQ